MLQSGPCLGFKCLKKVGPYQSLTCRFGGVKPAYRECRTTLEMSKGIFPIMMFASLYYWAGEFLDIHGETGPSIHCLQTAATSFQVNARECVLANYTLEFQNLPVGETRLHNIDDELATDCDLVPASESCQSRLVDSKMPRRSSQKHYEFDRTICRL